MCERPNYVVNICILPRLTLMYKRSRFFTDLHRETAMLGIGDFVNGSFTRSKERRVRGDQWEQFIKEDGVTIKLVENRGSQSDIKNIVEGQEYRSVILGVVYTAPDKPFRILRVKVLEPVFRTPETAPVLPPLPDKGHRTRQNAIGFGH
ncbi:MAG: hypothetical protein JWN89_358 [Parcubacteria group bacterium]|nr:hypothetical protein [Parcubacteria group bacterium]